jgi:hypothetical protein
MIMTIDHHIHAKLVQHRPDRAHVSHRAPPAFGSHARHWREDSPRERVFPLPEVANRRTGGEAQ